MRHYEVMSSAFTCACALGRMREEVDFFKLFTIKVLCKRLFCNLNAVNELCFFEPYGIGVLLPVLFYSR